MEPYDDKLPITACQFEYISKEWDKHPKLWLDDYIQYRKLPAYEVYYTDSDNISHSGYHAILILCDRTFSTPTFYMTTDIAKTNVIILALLNIAGYCETAMELQELISELIENIENSDAQKLPKSFATKKNCKSRMALSKSLDNYSDEPYISASEIKEKVYMMLKKYNLNINRVAIGTIIAILAEDYEINVSGRSVKIACNEIRRDSSRKGWNNSK
jgi:F420-dependent methylenetetrahydromethanopterin dehydrogenase